MSDGMNPIYDENSTILILGSLPSEESIKNQEYYSNRRNQFWKIISCVFENKIIEFTNYDEKVSFLKKYDIALWDVLSSADRIGSLDKDIKNGKYNDLNSFIMQNKIKKVFVNGSDAATYLKEYLKSNCLNIAYIRLTSSSGTNTKFSLEEKIQIWKKSIKGN